MGPGAHGHGEHGARRLRPQRGSPSLPPPHGDPQLLAFSWAMTPCFSRVCCTAALICSMAEAARVQPQAGGRATHRAGQRRRCAGGPRTPSSCAASGPNTMHVRRSMDSVMLLPPAGAGAGAGGRGLELMAVEVFQGFKTAGPNNNSLRSSSSHAQEGTSRVQSATPGGLLPICRVCRRRAAQLTPGMAMHGPPCPASLGLCTACGIQLREEVTTVSWTTVFQHVPQPAPPPPAKAEAGAPARTLDKEPTRVRCAPAKHPSSAAQPHVHCATVACRCAMPCCSIVSTTRRKAAEPCTCSHFAQGCSSC